MRLARPDMPARRVRPSPAEESLDVPMARCATWRTDDAMNLEILLYVVFRVAVSLPVLRWPLAGGLLAIAGDGADLLLRDVVDLGGLGDYQLLDKLMDQVYLALFLVVALRWAGVERRVSVALYLYRLVGALLFVVTGERAVLLLFPNVFELWFLLIALLHHRPEPVRWTGPRLALALAGLTLLKELQEWALHGARLFDGITSLEFLDIVRRWLTGAP
jgi:hypothetical protein